LTISKNLLIQNQKLILSERLVTILTVKQFVKLMYHINVLKNKTSEYADTRNQKISFWLETSNKPVFLFKYLRLLEEIDRTNIIKREKCYIVVTETTADRN
jgi:hypothetical protein